MSPERISLYALWALGLVNLGLTVRLVAWARTTTREVQAREVWSPELEIGQQAPTFRARTLDGKRVTERSYSGRAVAYVFLSPNCDGCRATFPQLQAFYPAAKAQGTEIVVVTDTGVKQTTNWLETFRVAGTQVVTPIVVAPIRESNFVSTYNGPSFFPYYCFVNADGIVAVRGIIGKEPWIALTEMWAGRGEGPIRLPRVGEPVFDDAR